MNERRHSFEYEDLLACGRGEMFGAGNAQLPLPPMLMFDRISEISETGGEYGKGSVVAWMTTMAHRRAVDRVRSVSSEMARDERYALHSGGREIDEVWDGVEQRLDIERVRKGMASLTAIQREALTLAYFGGYTQSQVAQLLKLPLGTVKTRIRDGLIGLRDALGVEA